jgi:hypothetical protein
MTPLGTFSCAPFPLCLPNKTGDFEFYSIWGRARTHREISQLLELLLRTPPPAAADSAAVAGMLELLRTQGMWAPSLLLAALQCVHGITFEALFAQESAGHERLQANASWPQSLSKDITGDGVDAEAGVAAPLPAASVDSRAPCAKRALLPIPAQLERVAAAMDAVVVKHLAKYGGAAADLIMNGTTSQLPLGRCPGERLMHVVQSAHHGQYSAARLAWHPARVRHMCAAAACAMVHGNTSPLASHSLVQILLQWR